VLKDVEVPRLTEFDVAGFCEENVSAFNVAVHLPRAVEKGETEESFADHDGDFLFREAVSEG
jgi:hypothetical protein